MTDLPRDFWIQSRRVVLPLLDDPTPARILVQGGRIAAVLTDAVGDPEHLGDALHLGDPAHLGGTPLLDVGDLVVTPGLVDTHAHINEPGRTDWEGFATATKAAAAGGITTVVDMPLNSIPPTVNAAALHEKASAAEGQCSIDYAFWGGVIPGNTHDLKPLIEAGVVGCKCFLIESGVDEFPKIEENELREDMKILAAADVPLLVHAELDTRADQSAPAPSPPSSGFNPQSYRTYLYSRPARWEIDAIRLVIRLARDTGCAVHIVHLSAADALNDLAAARDEGLPITVETCPHYLTVNSEEIPDGATHYKCAPPIREQENQDRLWKALRQGIIDFVVSDHSPCTPQLKQMERGSFEEAWGGISGLQFSLPVVWTEMRRRELGLADLVRWMSRGPAALAGLSQRKGQIAPGHDADLVVWDPEQSYTLDPSMIQHRHRLTPYEGRELFGRVRQTYVRGHRVFEDGQFLDKPAGMWLR